MTTTVMLWSAMWCSIMTFWHKKLTSLTRVTHDHHQPSSCYLSMLHHTGPEHSATGKYENRLKGFKHFNSRMAHTWPGEAVFYFTWCSSDPVCQLLAVMDGWCPHRPLTASSQELSFSLFFFSSAAATQGCTHLWTKVGWSVFWIIFYWSIPWPWSIPGPSNQRLFCTFIISTFKLVQGVPKNCDPLLMAQKRAPEVA